MDAVPPAPPSDSPRVLAAVGRLRAAGERVTTARCAVLRVIDAADAADEHLTAEQIGARVAKAAPEVHRATLYRTLTSLTDLGILQHVHLGGSATVYHLDAPVEQPAGTDGTDVHDVHDHAHVQCSVCGRVQDVPADVLADASRRIRDRLGFELDTSHAALLGTCRDCARRAPTPREGDAAGVSASRG
jgi:Fur family ferric uptake transcriptional regulator